MAKPLSEMTLEELWQLFPIILKEHNTEYQAWYELEKEKLNSSVGEGNMIRISHIGSTAVRGLLAKPTVDILLEISRDYKVEQMKADLTADGWSLMAYQEHPYMQADFNKGYTPEGFAEKVYHLHVRYYGDWDELYFRDYLNEHKEVAKEYAILKEGLLEQYRNNRDGYTEAKSEFVLKYSKAAKEYYEGRYLPDYNKEQECSDDIT